MRKTTSKGGLAGSPGFQAILIVAISLAFGQPARAGQSVTLAWNPAPGVPAAGYRVYYGGDCAQFTRQTDAGTNTTCNVTGLQGGGTNYFAVAAYDVNHKEGPLSSPIQCVLPAEGADPAAPAGGPAPAAVPDQNINVGALLILTNAASEPDNPARQITFILGAGAPAGAILSPGGIFEWSPVGPQGSTTNSITIWAVDNGTPALSNSVSFAVTVGAFVQVTIGSATAFAGCDTAVPVNLYSTVSLASLSFTVGAPAGRFTNWGFVPGNPAIARAAVQGSDPAQPLFNLALPGGQSPGAAPLGMISVQAVAGGDSVFAPLTVQNIVATASDTTQVGSVAGGSGRVALIAAQPLLETSFTNRAEPVLTIYGNPGLNYSVMSATEFSDPVNWVPFTNFTLVTPVQTITPGPATNRMEIFLAAQL